METSPNLPHQKPRPKQQSQETYVGRATLLGECAQIGWSRFERASAHLAAHAHRDCYEICYIVRGSVEWWAGSQIFQVGPRDVYVTSPGETHGGVDAFMHPCELYWIQVRPRSGALRDLAGLSRRHFSGGDVLASHFERLLSECRDATIGAPGRNDSIFDARYAAIAARAILHLLVLDTLRFHAVALQRQAGQPLAPSPPILAAMQWMRAHFDHPDCLQRAARIGGLRQTQFRKRFRIETGFSPHDYLLRAQLQEAKRRLSETNQPITAIAFDLGFSSSQYFATAFRRLVGLTPQDYRRHHARGGGAKNTKTEHSLP